MKSYISLGLKYKHFKLNYYNLKTIKHLCEEFPQKPTKLL